MKQHSTPQIGNAGRSRTLQALWLALANLLSLSVTLVMQAVLCRCMTTSEYGTYSQVLYVYNWPSFRWDFPKRTPITSPACRRRRGGMSYAN